MTCAHCLSYIITVGGPDDNGNLLLLSSGAPNGRGPGFIGPAEPAIATPLKLYQRGYPRCRILPNFSIRDDALDVVSVFDFPQIG